MTFRSWVTALAFVLSVPVGAPAVEIYLVRHAEKAIDDSKDPELTDLGRDRAANLAVVVKSAGIERIFSSDFKRTRDTARPLAALLSLEIEIYDPKTLEPFAAELLALQETALVVGHSNTTPELAELLGGDGGAPIDEEWEYDRLYLLQTDKGRVTRTILLHLPPGTARPDSNAANPSQ